MSTETNPKKRRRESYNVDVKQVEIYEDLASMKDEVRLKAAQELVSRFTPESKPTEDQVRKALQRLFRGLCSGRKAARIGFSVALTEVLSQVFASKQSVSGIGVSEAIRIFSTATDPSGSEPGQERKDYYLGRLFGAEAIIKSSILFQPGVPFEEWNTVVGIIIEIGNAKPWLREESGWVLYRALHELANQEAHVRYCEKMIETIRSNGFVKSPEGVAMWLLVQDAFPNAKLPQDVWKYNNDPLDRHDRRTLAKIMKQVSEAEDQSAASGVWNSRLNFAWDAVLSRLADSKPADSKKEKKDKKAEKESSRITFEEFWTEVVDDGLFAAASSDERKYWGFLLFMKIIEEGTLHRTEAIFTKNVVRCLMNQLAVEDRYLHRMAVKAVKTIQKRVSKEAAFASVAVKGLLGHSGSLQFDQITKVKTVEKIVLEADPESLKEIIQRLERLIAVPGTDEPKVAASSRQYFADLFVSIVRTRSSAGEDYTPVLQHILSLFVRYAYFGGEQGEQKQLTANPPISPATQELFRNRINSCLNSLISNIKDPAEVAYVVVRQIRDYQKSKEYGKFIIEIDGAIAESLDAAFKSLKKLSSKDDKDVKDASIQAFRLVYSLTILQVYNGDADAVSMLDELAFCYSKFWGDKKSKKEDRSDASNALVEILLSFASKPSKLFRRMSEQVFGVFADQITADGLQSLISVIEVKENLAGQQEMFDQQDDDEDEEMEDVDSLDSDVEVIDVDDADEENSDEDSGDEDEGEEDEEELAAFDAKLAEALGTHRPDDDNSDLSEADMNDDEMEAVDEMLVKVFKARQQATSKKKDKQDAKETMTNFKNRVLDILEIYVKKCHTSVLALDLILPLLRLVRKSTVKQISQRASDVLREYTRLCKGNAIPSLSTVGDEEDEEEDPIEPVWDLLRAVHKEAMISGLAAHSTAASQASIFLVKVLVAQNKQNISQIVDIYAETRKAQMLSNKCHVQPGFFTDWNNWCVNAGKSMKN
ncbi:DNA polymerase V, putative [Talaromyces stipitatus ATCC 10500]|uniref:DNA polymerase V, putative n=1 Tax=Talaromyces stipitatus (strain ATCC 10500 / CBS 375.48 / QM 6759 / NRRL 1006) TaxID=441959 RepID=B8LZH9_TALSN|nr:DNA polymerase V, putative [Talaromyces stipitatus ATCC 10500]EED22061.1 DNA polymerase V, putative [Talaromyces stipitatus ATCC 10500]